MLANIIDYRTNKHNVECDAVFEDSAHDNRVAGATQFQVYPVVNYHEILRTTVKDALAWVTSKDGHQTMYLYDPGSQDHRKLRARLDAKKRIHSNLKKNDIEDVARQLAFLAGADYDKLSPEKKDKVKLEALRVFDFKEGSNGS